MITSLLSKLEKEKNQWIYHAIDSFNEGFLRFDGQKYQKDQVLVGVYGPTQVGKTSLILTMLGIGDEQMVPLSRALRGKREKGKSSTITSFIYKRSPDDNFYLSFPDHTRICCSSLEDLETELKSIRNRIEKGEVAFEKPLILNIGRQFFTNKRFAEKGEHISIIDLPGDDTKEKREEAYVNYILTTYMPLCSVCLVMEISSKITRLFQLDRTAVKDWNEYPQRFRLVITRSLQSTSVKKSIETGEIASLDDLRGNFLYHLKRNGHVIPNKIFPLEFGDTWKDLKQKNGAVYQKAKGWMEQLFLELLDNLTAIKTPEHQIMQLKNIQHSIQNEKNVELEQLDNEIENVRETIGKESESLEQLKSVCEYLKGEISFYEQGIEKINTCKLEKFEYSFAEHFGFEEGEVVFTDRKTDKLIEIYHLLEKNMLEHFEKQLSKIAAGLRKVLRNLDLNVKVDYENAPPIIGLELKHGGGINQYLIPWNFEEDFSISSDTLADNHGIIQNYYAQQLNHLKTKAEKELRQALNSKIKIHRTAEARLMEKYEKIRMDSKILQEIETTIEDTRAEWNHDLERPMMLDKILKAEFLIAVSEMKNKLTSPYTSAPEKWAYHQYIQFILQQAERIIGNDYF